MPSILVIFNKSSASKAFKLKTQKSREISLTGVYTTRSQALSRREYDI